MRLGEDHFHAGGTGHFDQNPQRQRDHIEVAMRFIAKVRGKCARRPQRDAMHSFAREGDSTAARSMIDLRAVRDDLRRPL